MKEGLYAVGDVHGDFARVSALLFEAGLIDGLGDWTGEASNLVFVGDLTDRGLYGMEAIALVRRLQRQAEEVGGFVESLMGNHDAMILARAFELRGEPADPDCREFFILNGGKMPEARALAQNEETFAWLQSRPLMVVIDDTLFQHADSGLYYGRLGSNLEAVNGAGADLAKTAKGAWRIFYEMTDGRDWDTFGLRAPRTAEINLLAHLARFGMRRVVHGHTRHLSNEPLVYFGGHAINVDGSLSDGYRNDPNRGFVADLDAVGYPSA